MNALAFMSVHYELRVRGEAKKKNKNDHTACPKRTDSLIGHI